MLMLALNALIEGSRAGVQGAGFAVVAQEVRGVGQQVETIAKELEGQLTGRSDRFRVIGQSVAETKWFRAAPGRLDRVLA
jgi:methyl-accepting chemotaxis protein